MKTIHPLGNQPLDAILAFVEHVRTGVGYPDGLIAATTDAFEQSIVDGTEQELFELVDQVSASNNSCDNSKAFRVCRIPRPACRDCRYWKGHGVYCETGFYEQSAWCPSCSAWQPRAVNWIDVDPAHSPSPTELYKDGLDHRMFVFLANENRAVPMEAIEKQFANVEPVVVRAAVRHLCSTGDIKEVKTPESPNFPTAFRARIKYR